MAVPFEEKMMAMLSSAHTFDRFYKSAKELEDAERRGDICMLKQLDFGVAPMCMRCSMPCIDPLTKMWKPMNCGGCKGVIYCSRTCQVADWKKSKVAGAPSHKELCASNKEYMKRIPYFRSQFEQFPWARIESDGTCSHDILKARLSVLGSGASFGYWSVPGGLRPHDASPLDISPSQDKEGTSNRHPYQKQKTLAKAYIHGEVLFGDTWPTDVDAWKLKDEQVPRLFFVDEPPKRPQPGQIKDWRSWYEWRGLSLGSPAALMMDYPLSVYHLLVDILKVIDIRSTFNGKRTLDVDYIGAEVELNYLPLFSELALLLPDTHVNLTIFGKAAYDLVIAARESHPGSLATRNPVWSYTAPKKTGGGSIDIRIHAESEQWTRQALRSQDGPDAIVGMNAGLLSYSTWTEPMLMSAILDIPFGVTEYAEQSMDACATALPNMFAQQARGIGNSNSEFYKALMKKRVHPVSVNPFHRPGQRSIPVVRMPNHYNGFVMPVVMGE